MEPSVVEFAIGIVATLIVVGINYYAKRTGKRIGRAWLTAGLYVLACLLAVVFKPISLPPAPIYSGDPVVFSQVLTTYISALVTVAGAITGFATVIYNTLIAKVLDKVIVAARLR